MARACKFGMISYGKTDLKNQICLWVDGISSSEVGHMVERKVWQQLVLTSCSNVSKVNGLKHGTGGELHSL